MMQINMPSCYIQEKGALCKIASYFPHLLEDGALIIMDAFAYQRFKEEVLTSFETRQVGYAVERLEGECCKENIEKFIDSASTCGAKCVIGVGGGKVLDVAKAVGYFGKMKTIMVPTSASTDGACSKLSVLYESDGTFKEYLYLHKNPDGVLVDLEVIAQAPARLLRAGIGDALSTYFETEAGYAGAVERNEQKSFSQTARALSKRCLDILLSEGEKAVQAVERQEVDQHLEAVVEAIIYLSCIGFENGSLAAAHAVCNALSSQTKYNHLLHGEKVAFGTVVQLVLEKQSWDVIRQITDLCSKIGLPYTPMEIGLQQQDVSELARLTCELSQPIHHMRKVFVEEELVKSAIIFTQRLILEDIK